MFSPTTKILIVDDMPTMRKLVKKACTTLGFTDMIEAVNGAEAWETLQNNAGIGLIISDWNMPQCTGIDFLKRVRSDSRFKTLPFVLLTAEAEAAQVKEALTAGVSNYIVKPFTPASFKEKIEQTYKNVSKSA